MYTVCVLQGSLSELTHQHRQHRTCPHGTTHAYAILFAKPVGRKERSCAWTPRFLHSLHICVHIAATSVQSSALAARGPANHPYSLISNVCSLISSARTSLLPARNFSKPVGTTAGVRSQLTHTK
jgi:hypothetical protein